MGSACCEASLDRLVVEYKDLCYQHRVDLTVRIEDTVRTDLCIICFHGGTEEVSGGEGEVHRAVGGEPRSGVRMLCIPSHHCSADTVVVFLDPRHQRRDSTTLQSFHPIGSPKIIWRTRFCMSEEQIWLQSMNVTLLSRH
ncbi:unnamed protein product [Musa hybrid cultivar]